MITLAAAGAIGIAVQQQLDCWPAIWIALLGVGLWVIWRSSRRAAAGLARWCGVLLVGAATLALRAAVDQSLYQQATLLQMLEPSPAPAVVQGRVSGLVQRLPHPASGLRDGGPSWRTAFDLRVSGVRHGDRVVPCSGRLAVRVDDDVPTIRSGDQLRLYGQLSGLSAPSNPGVADYRRVARNRRQHGWLAVAQGEQVERLAASAPSLLRLADRLSRSGEQTLHACLGPQTGALAAALVVGRRQAIDPQLKDQLLETGTIHLLSVSGLHMGIVALVLHQIGVLLGLRRGVQLVFVASLCMLFVAVTGARPPVIRAAILVGTVLLARAVGRQDSPLNSLALAAWLLMLLNPTNLFQVGVHLSFIAVATLFCCGNRFDPVSEAMRSEDRLDRLVTQAKPAWRRRLGGVGRGLASVLWFSLCVTLATMPLVWLRFNVVTPIAVPTNVVLSMPMAVGLISGLLAVTVGSLLPWLALPIAWVCQGALLLMQRVIDVAAELPLGHFWLPAPPSWWVAVYYLGAALLLIAPVRRRRARLFVIAALLWAVAAWGLATLPQHRLRDELQATFLDVGHGTCVVVQLPDGRNLLYDCGSLGNFTHSARGIQEPLWALGLSRLDAILLSHADADHYNALPAVLRRFAVDQLVVPRGMLDVDKSGLEPIRQAIQRYRIPVLQVSREARHLWGDRQINILHPPRVWVDGNENANSLVVDLRHGGRSLILPGDLESPGLELVVAGLPPPPGGVLMASHHGSLTLDHQAMLAWAKPAEVIVSGGRRALNPEVRQALSAGGAGVHITARQGAIRSTVSAAGVDIRGWLEHPW